MEQKERRPDLTQVLISAIEGRLSEAWVALPCLVVSYDITENTVSCQPALKVRVRTQQTGASASSLLYDYVTIKPLIHVPVVFPGGGGYGITFPLQVGDEVLVVFASRCIDNWWEQGGIQLQAEYRTFDINDGFAIPSPRSKPNVPPAISTSGMDIRSDDGTLKIHLEDGQVTITAPSGVVINGNLTVNGTVAATGEGTFLGTHTVSGHIHGGVEAGGDTTAPPEG